VTQYGYRQRDHYCIRQKNKQQTDREEVGGDESTATNWYHVGCCTDQCMTLILPHDSLVVQVAFVAHLQCTVEQYAVTATSVSGNDKEKVSFLCPSHNGISERICTERIGAESSLRGGGGSIPRSSAHHLHL